MRKIALPLVALLSACMSAPAYRAPNVQLAPAFGVPDRRSSPQTAADSCPTDTAAAAPATSVHFSRSLSPAPFWRTLDDSVLTALVEEALRDPPRASRRRGVRGLP